MTQTAYQGVNELPKYKCHKEVWALKIAELKPLPGGDAMLIPEDEGYDQFIVDNDYVAKHMPYPGGFYVVYQDGYVSFSPPVPFVQGYTKV